MLRLCRLANAVNVHYRQTNLEEYQGVGSIEDCPGNPEQVAQEKHPEAPIAFEFPLGRDQPRGENGNGHCRPLHQIQQFRRNQYACPKPKTNRRGGDDNRVWRFHHDFQICFRTPLELHTFRDASRRP